MVRISVIGGFFFLAFVNTASADVFKDIWGILTDPLKLGQGTSNVLEAIERSSIHADRLGDDLNQHVKERIEQLNGVIANGRQAMLDTVGSAEQSAIRVLQEVRTAQRAVFDETRGLAKCVASVTAQEIQENIAQSLNDLGERKPRIRLFGFTILSVKFDQADFPSPIEAYRTYKTLADQRFAKVEPSDHPSKITDLSSDLQRQAEITRCHYKQESALFAELMDSELEYIRRDQAWIGRVTPP